MEQNLDQTVALLARTPASLDALLRGLPDAWTRANEGENTWSAYDILGHLIYCERTDWLPRAKIILKFGDARPFDPFDRMGHVHDVQGKSLHTLLDEFGRRRSENLTELRALNLQQQDLNRPGNHPSLGPVTLSQLLAAWAAHDLNHLHQLGRVMALQYREAVGPWAQYMGAMHCKAHSAPA
jgi:hypothetical protein